MCGNEKIERGEHLAFAFQIGPHGPVVIRDGAVPWQHVDAPQQFAHDEMQTLCLRSSRQPKEQLAFGNLGRPRYPPSDAAR